PWYDRRSSCVTQRPKWDAMRPSSSRVGVLTGIALSSFLHTAHTVVPRLASLARALRLCIRGLRLRGDPACGEGEPRALRCRDVPTAVGLSFPLPASGVPPQSAAPLFAKSQTVGAPSCDGSKPALA